MKNYIYILFVLILTSSCISDDSTLLYPNQNPDFSHITISSPTDTLSVDFGQSISFTPEVTQTLTNEELSYKWVTWPLKDGQKEDSLVIGFDNKLDYAFNKSGKYILRLEVKNKDYSNFKSWLVQVRVYDQGYMVIGMDESGASNIAFARKLSSTDILEGKELTFISGLIKAVNPNITIENVVHVGKSILSYGSDDARLLIFCEDIIYVADANTFEIFTSVSLGDEFPGEKIAKVSIMDTYASSANILTESGKPLVFNKAEFILYESGFLSGNYEDMYPNLFSTTGVNQNLDQLFVDYSTSKIWSYIPYHGAGKPINNTTGTTAPYDDNVLPNIYKDYNIISVGRMNGDYFDGTNSDFISVATNKVTPKEVKIVRFNTSYSSGIVNNDIIDYVSEDPITLPAKRELTANARYSAMYYYNQNKVYLWNPLNLAPNNQLPKNAAITLAADKEITCMAVSYDMRELYIGFYDHAAPGTLKGGMYVYKCGDLGITPNPTPSETFEGITTRPVQVLYKTEGWGQYNSGS